MFERFPKEKSTAVAIEISEHFEDEHPNGTIEEFEKTAEASLQKFFTDAPEQEALLRASFFRPFTILLSEGR